MSVEVVRCGEKSITPILNQMEFWEWVIKKNCKSVIIIIIRLSKVYSMNHVFSPSFYRIIAFYIIIVMAASTNWLNYNSKHFFVGWRRFQWKWSVVDRKTLRPSSTRWSSQSALYTKVLRLVFLTIMTACRSVTSLFGWCDKYKVYYVL